MCLSIRSGIARVSFLLSFFSVYASALPAVRPVTYRHALPQQTNVIQSISAAYTLH